jgi:hypothetical protein
LLTGFDPFRGSAFVSNHVFYRLMHLPAQAGALS